jgi:hypothetical protein
MHDELKILPLTPTLRQPLQGKIAIKGTPPLPA